MYNKRTWLNKENSPSMGSVVAFDGDVKYSDGSERTTFLAISDCAKTIKLSRNTESIEDFIDKMKLLKSEIDLFINYLTQKNELVKADVIKSVCEPHDFQPVLVGEYSFYRCTKCKVVQ